MTNTTPFLAESEIHKLIGSQAYRQSNHPDHAKTHELVRNWYISRYNKPEQANATDKSFRRGDARTNNIWKNLGNVLLVGEGNLSFAKSIASSSLFGISAMTASTYESERSLSEEGKSNADALKRMGVTVMHNVDATRLENELKPTQFDTIIFQFPNVGSREPIHGHNPNHILLRKFLKSAAAFLKLSGKILVSTVDSPHYEGAFQVEDAAKFGGFDAPEAYPFDPAMFSGYSHINANDEESALEDNKNHKKFSTWLFRKA